MAESINIIIKNGAEKEVRHLQCVLVAAHSGLTLAPPLPFPTPTLLLCQVKLKVKKTTLFKKIFAAVSL